MAETNKLKETNNRILRNHITQNIGRLKEVVKALFEKDLTTALDLHTRVLIVMDLTDGDIGDDEFVQYEMERFHVINGFVEDLLNDYGAGL
jgi:hypothetical protein